MSSIVFLKYFYILIVILLTISCNYNFQNSSYWDSKTLVPIIIFIITLRIQKIREIDKKNKDKEALYDFFIRTIKKIIENTRQQLPEIKKGISNLKTNPIYLSRLKHSLPDDIERLSERIKIEDLYYAYLKIHNTSEYSKSNFSFIISKLDFINKTLNTLRKYDDDNYNEAIVFMKDYQRSFSEFAYNNTIEISFELNTKIGKTISESILLKKIEEVQENVSKNNNNNNHNNQIENIQANFISPLIQFLSKNRDTKFSASLLNLCRNANMIYLNEVSKSTRIVAHLENYHDSLERNLIELEKLANIKSNYDFNPSKIKVILNPIITFFSPLRY